MLKILLEMYFKWKIYHPTMMYVAKTDTFTVSTLGQQQKPLIETVMIQYSI